MGRLTGDIMKKKLAILLCSLFLLQNVTGLQMVANAVTALEITVHSETLGNIFSNGNPPALTVEFRADGPMRAGADYRAYRFNDNAKGDLVWQEEGVILLSADTSAEKTIRLPGLGYGRYLLSVSAGGQTAEQEFSIVNSTPDNPVRNPEMGAHAFTNWENRYQGAQQLSSYGTASEVMDILALGGFGEVRNGVKWHNYERTYDYTYQGKTYPAPQKGYYEILPLPRAFLDEAKSHNIHTLEQLGFANEFYPDPGSDTMTVPYTDEQQQAFANYAASQAAEFLNAGYTDVYEVWNEWNISAFNASNRPADDYGRLVVKTAQAVKDVNPDAELAAGVITYTYNDDLGWLRTALSTEVNGQSCADAISILSLHPYNLTASPDYPDTRTITRSQQVRDMLDNEFDRPDAELWATEIGWTTCNGTTGGEAAVSHLEQAVYSVKLMAMNRELELFDKVFWYCLQEPGPQPEITNQERDDGFGLTRSSDTNRPDGDPAVPFAAKDAYLALANWNTLMTDAQFVQRVPQADEDTYLYEFQTASGQPLYIGWSRGGEVSASGMDFAGGTPYRIDLYGNAEELSGTPVLGEQPAYFTSGAQMLRHVTVSYDMQENIVSLEGVLSSQTAGEWVAVDVYSQGADDGAALPVYRNQGVAANGGKFKFSFQVPNGDYTARIYSQSKGAAEQLESTFSIRVPGVQVQQNGNIIAGLEELKGGQPFTIWASSDALQDGQEVLCVSALRKDGRMLQIGLQKATVQNGVVSASCTPDQAALEQADLLDVFIWKDKERMVPLMEKTAFPRNRGDGQ